MRFVLKTALVLAFISAGTSQGAFGQSVRPVELRGSEVHEFRANAGALYEISVAFPLDYDPTGDTRYPVLYVTDATLVFPLVVQTYRFLARQQEARPILVVGIDRPTRTEEETKASRYLDLTPTRVPEVERSNESRLGHDVRSGGADAFLDILNMEIIPWVDGRWPTSGDRGLAGYSLSGLFATHVLLTAPESFDHYLIGSPSLWWDGRVMFEREEAYAGRADDLPAHVFLSVGTEEGRFMLANAVRLAETLISRDYESLELEWQILQGETHVSGIPVAISRGLRALYGGS